MKIVPKTKFTLFLLVVAVSVATVSMAMAATAVDINPPPPSPPPPPGLPIDGNLWLLIAFALGFAFISLYRVKHKKTQI